MTTTKKIASLLLAMLVIAALPIAARGEGTTIRLYEIYGDSMLFQQGAPVLLAGTAPDGTELRAELYQGDTLLAGADGTAQGGKFVLELPGQAGSYTEYKIVLSSEGQDIRVLARVVFGELWLAGGQSNMDWQFGITPEGFRARTAGEVPAEPWVRMLLTPGYPAFEGDPHKLPLLPQEDIPGARWLRGDSMDAYSFSAVAWYFARDLQEALGVPVGVLGASLGGSSIYTWLSRDAIECTPRVKADVAALWRYLPAAGWGNYPNPNHHQDMTVNYNKRIFPLRHFRPAGLIWYQGETEVIGYLQSGTAWAGGVAYKRALTALRDSWAQLFNRPGLSLVATNLAGYAYEWRREPAQPGLFNALLGEIEAADSNIAAVAIYDVPLNWDMTREVHPSFGDTGSIHPYTKQPIGEKMALAARGLRYGAHYATPLLQTAEVQGSDLLLTFMQTGEGLFLKGDTRLRGFSLAGADGYYHEAKAEITASNQVKVSCEGLAEPRSAAYAVGLYASNANLFASFADGKELAASPFVTQQLPGTVYLRDVDWRSCDFAETWQKKSAPRFVPAFSATGKGAAVSFEEGYISLSGGTARRFGLMPEDGMGDYSRAKSISFWVRNPGTQPVTLTGIRFYTWDYAWYSPPVRIKIPANSDWQEITVELGKLYLYGRAFAPLMQGSTMLLKDVRKLELRFAAKSNANVTVDLDEFSFAPRQAKDGFGYSWWRVPLGLLHPLRTAWAVIVTFIR